MMVTYVTVWSSKVLHTDTMVGGVTVATDRSCLYACMNVEI